MNLPSLTFHSATTPLWQVTVYLAEDRLHREVSPVIGWEYTVDEFGTDPDDSDPFGVLTPMIWSVGEQASEHNKENPTTNSVSMVYYDQAEVPKDTQDDLVQWMLDNMSRNRDLSAETLDYLMNNKKESK